MNDLNFRLSNSIYELETNGKFKAVALLKIYQKHINKNGYIDIYNFFDMESMNIIEDAFI